MSELSPSRRPNVKPALERLFERGLFQARWLMAPFYVGLVVALGALLVVFVMETWREVSHLGSMTPTQAILMALSLIDLSLAGNLLLIVLFSGYESFVSKIDTGDDEDRPGWMGRVDFSGMKIKLMASIAAISAIALLRAFVRLAEGEEIPDRHLIWLVGAHLTFVVSGLLLALMDLIVSRTEKH